MLIFTLPGWYKSAKHPENCIFIYEQMQAIRKYGHQVVVLSVQQVPVYKMRKADKSIKMNNDNGIITYTTEINTFYPSKLKKFFVYQFKNALNRLVNEAKKDVGVPDVYYAHFSFPAGYAATYLGDGIPLVVEEHFSALMGFPDKELIEIIKKTVAQSSWFICVSQGLKESVERCTEKNDGITVISNLINPCFTYYALTKSTQFVFFSLGSLISRKGFDLLITAFAEEFKDDNDVVLRIGGSGEEKENLIKIINAHCISDRVHLIGQLTREQTLIEYKKCNCFVLVSRAETYGLVYREAMAVGRPIISTRHGGFSDDWLDEFGYLVDVDSKDQLKNALRNMYVNYSKFNHKEISEKCLKSCSADAVAGQIVDILRDSIKN